MTLVLTDSFLSLLLGCSVSTTLDRASIHAAFLSSIFIAIFPEVYLYWRSPSLIFLNRLKSLIWNHKLDPPYFAYDRRDRFHPLRVRWLFRKQKELTSVSSPSTWVQGSDRTSVHGCPVHASCVRPCWRDTSCVCCSLVTATPCPSK